MPKTTIICEKPNLMREVAATLADMTGAPQSRVGNAIRVGDYTVCAFIGHVFGLAYPKAYGAKWAVFSDISSLPCVVEEGAWKMEVNPNLKELVAEVKKHVLAADVIVNCGDPEREGQLLVDEALYEFGVNPFGDNVFRLWSQTLSRADLTAAINGLFPNSQKQRLYEAAVTRSRADWQHGMTYSPLFTHVVRKSGYQVTIPVGRVQTPTLAIVVRRDLERLNFKPIQHFKMKIDVQHANGTFKANWVIPKTGAGLDGDGRLVDKGVIDAVAARIKDQTGEISNYQSGTKQTAQPLTFSLNDMQKKCARERGLELTAQETLDTLQELYDKHITSYPRTDTGYLRKTLLPEVPGILGEIAKIPEFADLAASADTSIISPSWNDAKVSDHYGLIPINEFTAAKVAGLGERQKKVLFIIIRQYLAQFFPVYRYRSVQAEVKVKDQYFKASGVTPIEMGWKCVFAKGSDESERDEDDTAIPEIARGDAITAREPAIKADMTSPPPAFNDDRLLEAMENCHIYETDPDIKKRLKEGQGIGRPATRAGIIEGLIKKNFLRREGKVGLVSTDLGRSDIEILPPQLKSAGMTAIWEEALERIENGEMTGAEFLSMQAEELRKGVEQWKDMVVEIKGAKKLENLPGTGNTCPKCKEGKLITRQFINKTTKRPQSLLVCDRGREVCDYVDWDAGVEKLPGDGKECPVCHKGVMKTKEFTKDGKTQRFLSCNAYPACRHAEWADNITPLPGDGKACTACGKGVMKTKEFTKDGKTKKYLSCSAYPTCRHAEWPSTTTPLPGDGKPCTACGKGVMKTKEFTKDGKTKKYLSCNAYPTCRNAEWPDNKKGKT